MLTIYVISNFFMLPLFSKFSKKKVFYGVLECVFPANIGSQNQKIQRINFRNNQYRVQEMANFVSLKLEFYWQNHKINEQTKIQ